MIYNALMQFFLIFSFLKSTKKTFLRFAGIILLISLHRKEKQASDDLRITKHKNKLLSDSTTDEEYVKKGVNS